MPKERVKSVTTPKKAGAIHEANFCLSEVSYISIKEVAFDSGAVCYVHVLQICAFPWYGYLNAR